MRPLTFSLACLAWIGGAGLAWSHGFRAIPVYNAMSQPIGFNITSDSNVFDLAEFMTGPENLFLETFGTAVSEMDGTFPDGIRYRAPHGFVEGSALFPLPTPFIARYDIVSPVFFSNGIGTGPGGSDPAEAIPALAGTVLRLTNVEAGNLPGAEAGTVLVDGTGVISMQSGYGVSMGNAHELQKDLFIGSGPIDGAYGFAFTFTVQFPNLGITLTSPRLVDVFTLPDFGDDLTLAGIARQDGATQAIYDAAMAVPEPSSLVMLAIGGAGLAIATWRRRRF
jgi:hypothetical protein